MSEFTVNDVSLFYEIKGNPEGKEAVAFLNGVKLQLQAGL